MIKDNYIILVITNMIKRALVIRTFSFLPPITLLHVSLCYNIEMDALITGLINARTECVFGCMLNK